MSMGARNIKRVIIGNTYQGDRIFENDTLYN